MKLQPPHRVLVGVAIAIAVLVVGALSKAMVKSMWKHSASTAPPAVTAGVPSEQPGPDPASAGKSGNVFDQFDVARFDSRGAFDVAGARAAGYKDDLIAEYLGTTRHFDVAAARKAGYSPAEIIDHLTATHTPAAYWECFLDKLPTTMNDVAARAVAADCRERHPEEPGPVPPKPSHIFGYSSPAACIADKARGTTSEQAARGIAAACNALY